MAMTSDAPTRHFEPIDPDAEPMVEDVQVAVPELGGIDLQQLVFNYDRDSDILLFYPYGKDRPAVAAGGSDNVYVLIDPDSEEFVGIQIDDFLSRAMKDRPSLFDVLDVAELRGMTIADVREARQRALGYRGRFRAWLRGLLLLAPKYRQGRKRWAVNELVNDKRLHLTTRPSLGAI